MTQNSIDNADLEKIKKENQQATNRLRSLFKSWMVIERREREIIAQCKTRGTRSSPNTTQPWEFIRTQ